jgi:hypothetical protein
MNYGELMKRSQPPQRPFAVEIKVVRGGHWTSQLVRR